MPILNHRDYRLAKARIAQLVKATGRQGLIHALQEGLPADLSAARTSTLRQELSRLEAEVAAYEKLQGDDGPANIEADELGLLPILARIGRNLSQKQLADGLGLKEQQIQRYERDRYATISLRRYQEILAHLDVEIHPRLSDRPSRSATAVQPEFNLSPELLRTLRNRAWLDLPRSMPRSEMIEKLHAYIREGSRLSGGQAFNRRACNSSASEGVVELWRARVLQVASNLTRNMKGRFNIADSSWLSDLLRLSVFPDGPVRAISYLRDRGIIVVVEPHLPGTALDGGAFLLEGIPVIALTLRYDRIDSFWFTLFHELAHIFLHFNSGLEAGFVDDDLQESRISDIEREADDFARNKLISDEVWKLSPVRFTKSSDAVEVFARSLNIHPAIVAGRIRRERDYKLFSKLVGSGQLKALFESLPERGD